MKLEEIYSTQNKTTPVISFEVFPPKDGNNQKLYDELKILKQFNPALISLTYGAGGSNRNSSLNIINHLKNEMDLNIMPHFTCVCSSKQEIELYLKEIESIGIENILALRGDEPKEIDVCHNDFKYANELVEFIHAETTLSIGVAGYPETHVNCCDLFTDIENLKRKCDAGASAIYTQLFFDNDKFFSFVQLVRDAGIYLPIVAGILPIISYGQLEKMLSMVKVNVPTSLMNRLERYKDNPSDVKKIGVEFASYQCQQLIDAEIAGMHFYTLNKAYSTSEILSNVLIA